MVHARWPKELAVCIAILAAAHDLSAQVAYTVVADLGTVGGAAPLGGVIRGTDGALYGTTSEGGAENCGIVYRIHPTGALSRIHEFSQPDGCRPVGELALGPDGSLYGVTERGGNADPQQGAGTIYKIALDGTFTVLHRFAFPLAQDPQPWLVPFRPFAGLTLAPDGFFYGTTISGDIYRISPAGAFALVVQFAPPDMEPKSLVAALTLGSDGFLYGSSPDFELIVPRDGGTIFRVDLAGNFEVLRRFFVIRAPDGSIFSPEGARPEGELAEGPNGEFYSANRVYGPNVGDQGTILRLQPDRTVAVLHPFSVGANQSYADGANPRAGLILGADGYVYGTTSAGGANGNGTIFRVSRDGGLATLRSFAQDGFAPTKGRLLEAAPGVFYGTAPSATGGVVYELRVAGALLAESRFVTTNEEQPVNGVLTASGAGPSATFSLQTNGSLGVATIDPTTGAFTYTPNLNASGTDAFTFSVTDGARQSNIATVTVRITEVNDAPVAFDSSITTAENTPVQGTLSASDVDSSSRTFAVVTNAAKGTVELNQFTGLFTYTPNLGATGLDSFTFQVRDEFGLVSNVATVTITVVPTPLAISLVAPVGGEKLFAGYPTTIQWTVTGAVGIDVELSRDGGRSFAPIAGCAGLPGSSTSCTWTPTGPPTPKARIRVVAHNAGGEQVSDVTDNLRIAVASPRVKLVFPHTGVGLETGTTQTIWWTHNLGERSFVGIELSRDGGASWEVIGTAVQNMTAQVGAFDWLVTGPATSTAILRVTSLSTNVSDVNNRPFEIVIGAF